MNKKVLTIIGVLIVAVLCALAVIFAPNIMEFILRFHTIPQH
jgi:hypothetical protein